MGSLSMSRTGWLVGEETASSPQPFQDLYFTETSSAAGWGHSALPVRVSRLDEDIQPYLCQGEPGLPPGDVTYPS